MIRRRLLKVTFKSGEETIVFKEDMDIKVRISKVALKIQNRATIEISGMTTQLRESLLSRITAWKHRLRQSGREAPDFVDVTVEAGYNQFNHDATSVVFVGQVATVGLYSGPPDITVRLTCYTRQIDRTQVISLPPPTNVTFLEYVQWAAKQMDLNYICDTSYNDRILVNPGRSTMIVSAILVTIQDMYQPDVAAYIDDNYLIVKDRDKMFNPEEIAQVREFVGIPGWNEWGVEFNCLFDKEIRLGSGANLESVMNPSINGNYVITSLEYDLTSRDRPFYVKAFGSPPA